MGGGLGVAETDSWSGGGMGGDEEEDEYKGKKVISPTPLYADLK
jgi:hypothetical protein